MKKLVMIAVIIGFACILMACSEVTTTSVRTTTTMNENLGGMYYVDGIRYVAIVKGADPDYVAQLQANYAKAWGNTVRFVYVDHSYNELNEIRHYLWNYREEFDIVGMGISEQYNTLRITVLELTDEIVEAIKEITGLDNIIIEEGNYPVYTDEIETA